MGIDAFWYIISFYSRIIIQHLFLSNSCLDASILSRLEEMLARLEQVNGIANLDVTISERRDLHTEAGLVAAGIDDTISVERGTGLVAVGNTCRGVYVG